MKNVISLFMFLTLLLSTNPIQLSGKSTKDFLSITPSIATNFDNHRKVKVIISKGAKN